MNVRVVYNKKEASIRVEPGWTVMKLMTKIQKQFGVEISRQRLYSKNQQLSSEMILSEDLLGSSGVTVFRNNILYVHFNGVCVPLMTPPSQKIKTVLECYSKVFAAKGRTINTASIDCYYRATKLDLNFSFRHYNIQDEDTVVIVNREEQKQVPPEWQTILSNMKERIKALEHQVEYDELTIAELSALLQNLK